MTCLWRIDIHKYLVRLIEGIWYQSINIKKKENHHVPSWVEFFVELFLDIRSNVLFKRSKATMRWSINNVKTRYKQYIIIQNLTFSMLYLDRATEAISTASCCIGSDMSAFFITAFLCSAILESISKAASGSKYNYEYVDENQVGKFTENAKSE